MFDSVPHALLTIYVYLITVYAKALITLLV